jgi:hypothetical protein
MGSAYSLLYYLQSLLDFSGPAAFQGIPLKFCCDVCIYTVHALILSLIVGFSSETFAAGVVLPQIFKECASFLFFTPYLKLFETIRNFLIAFKARPVVKINLLPLKCSYSYSQFWPTFCLIF